MCHGNDSRPPAAPGALAAASDGPVVLTASDGTRVLAHQARSASAAEVIGDLQAPLLMLIAGADAAIPLADSAALAAAAGERVDVERVVFDDAPHSFFDRFFAEHEADCLRAWQGIGRFIAAHR